MANKKKRPFCLSTVLLYVLVVSTYSNARIMQSEAFSPLLGQNRGEEKKEITPSFRRGLGTVLRLSLCYEYYCIMTLVSNRSNTVNNRTFLP